METPKISIKKKLKMIAGEKERFLFILRARETYTPTPARKLYEAYKIEDKSQLSFVVPTEFVGIGDVKSEFIAIRITPKSIKGIAIEKKVAIDLTPRMEKAVTRIQKNSGTIILSTAKRSRSIATKPAVIIT